MNVDLRSKQLKTAQDRPIPIETHGVNNIRINSLIARTRHTLNQIKSPEIKRGFDELLDLVQEASNSRTQFDTIRENIEILWNRLQRVSGQIGNFTGGTSRLPTPAVTPVSTPGSTPGSGSTEEDLHLFAYDVEGERVISEMGTNLVYDTEIIDEAPYQFSPDGYEILIRQTGYYEINFDASFGTGGDDIVELKIQRDTGLGYEDVEGSISYAVN